MTNFQEINDLRKQGRLEDAYQLASSYCKDAPADIWAKRAMGWVIYEYLDRTASVNTASEFLHWLAALLDIGVDESESMLFNSVAWSIRKLLVDAGEKEVSSVVLDQLLSSMKQFEFPKLEKSYSAMLSAALKLESKWSGLYQFINWWGLENLQPNDYKEVRLENGVSIMALAERSFIAYSKSLLKCEAVDVIGNAIPFLRNFVSLHPDYLYPPYYLAKLYLKVGDRETAFAFLKPFAKSKQKDFWVWQLLADTQQDESVRLSFICKALLCGGKEEMLVSLREVAALLFSNLGYHSEAKAEVLNAVETRNRNNWGMTNNLRSLQVEKWFVNVPASHNNRSFYMKHVAKAESLIVGESIKVMCLVTYVNKEKQMVSFVTEDKTQGFFKIPKGTPQLQQNQMIEIAVNDNVGGKTMVKSVRVEEGTDNPSFFKAYEGNLKLIGGFGLVGGIFVEPKFLSGKSDREKVSGVAVISFDKKKDKWGWKVLTINSLK